MKFRCGEVDTDLPLMSRNSSELCEGEFVKRAALVNPATILGPNLTPVSRAGIGLKHSGSVGFQYAPLGLINGLAERRTR